MPHRVVAVADSVQRGRGVTVGLMGGQDIFTVPNMTAKLEAQLRGLGGGFLPEFLARPHIDAGRLVEKKVVHSITDKLESTDSAYRKVDLSYAWMGAPQPDDTGHGQALQWWLTQLGTATTRRALLQGL
jgi:DNA-binding transcriptional LysR family regulator